MDDSAAIIIGLVVTLSVGLAIGPLLKKAAPDPQTPDGFPDKLWQQLISARHGGFWIGGLERGLVFAAFWMHSESLVAAWLAFKLASKWEAWRNVVQVPSKIEALDELQWYAARNTLGSWLLTRFWVGTLASVLAGLVGAGVARALT